MVKRPVVTSSFIIIILLYTGLVPVYSRHAFRCIFPEPDIARIKGTVASSPVRSSSGTTYSVLVEVSEASTARHWGNTRNTASCSGRVRLYVPSQLVEALYPGALYSKAGKDALLLESGLVIQAQVRFIQPKESRTVPCAVDETQFYASELDSEGWSDRLNEVRALLRLQLKRLLYAWGAAGGLLLALISGAREYTDPAIQESFRNAGLSHILALSGMHLSLFSSLSEKTAGQMLGKRFQPLLSLASAFLFVWFAGISPSLTRALICMCIATVAEFCCLRLNLLETVCTSFIIHVMLFPEDAGSPAFMLSYGALLGLYAGEKLLMPVFSAFMPPALARGVSASAGAQLCTTPVSLLLFGECRPAGVIASVFVSPPASLFVTGGIIAVLGVLLLPFLLHPVGVIMNCLYDVIRYLTALFAQIPGITFT